MKRLSSLASDQTSNQLIKHYPFGQDESQNKYQSGFGKAHISSSCSTTICTKVIMNSLDKIWHERTACIHFGSKRKSYTKSNCDSNPCHSE